MLLKCLFIFFFFAFLYSFDNGQVIPKTDDNKKKTSDRKHSNFSKFFKNGLSI